MSCDRALAGFLYKVGLLPKDNDSQAPFAYKMYKRTDAAGLELCAGFKQTYCRAVTIDFMGVWWVPMHRLYYLWTDSSWVGIRLRASASSWDELFLSQTPIAQSKLFGMPFPLMKCVVIDYRLNDSVIHTDFSTVPNLGPTIITVLHLRFKLPGLIQSMEVQFHILKTILDLFPVKALLRRRRNGGDFWAREGRLRRPERLLHLSCRRSENQMTSSRSGSLDVTAVS